MTTSTASHADYVAAYAVELARKGVRFDRIAAIAETHVSEAGPIETDDEWTALLTRGSDRIEVADLVVRDAARLAGEHAYATKLAYAGTDGELHTAQQEAEREEARVLGWGMAGHHAL